METNSTNPAENPNDCQHDHHHHHHNHLNNHNSHHSHHEHYGHHSHLHEHAPRAIIRAILITILFMMIELIGGWLANSLALISDAAHMLTDIGAMSVSLFALWLTRRAATPTMTFGYHRAEILGALASGLSIWLISGFLILEAIQRVTNPPEVQGKIVFIVATFGLLANLMSMRMLHHSKDNINVRAAYIHLFADSLGSVGAIIAGLILWFTGWRLIDPIITIFFAILMLVSSWALVKESMEVLMESVPRSVDPLQIQKDLQAIQSVKEVHDLHIWTVSKNKVALAVHLLSDQPDTTLSAANQLLKDKHAIIHTTIQIEHPEKFRSEGCYDCHRSAQ